MSVNRPRPEEEVLLRDVDEVVVVAEKKNGAWPQLGEVTFSTVPPERPSFAERVTLWTMVLVLLVVTLNAVLKDDQKVLIALLVIAAGTLVRLTRLRLAGHKPGEENNDPKTKKRRKKRAPPE